MSRGILERLDERELDAVVAHEIGYIKHWDFAVMTVAAVIPMLLYLLFSATRDADDDETRCVSAGAYAAYLVSELTILGLSRARETAADLWSCECTGDGDALRQRSSRSPMGLAKRRPSTRSRSTRCRTRAIPGRRRRAGWSGGWDGHDRCGRWGSSSQPPPKRCRRPLPTGIDPERALGAMRWETVNPWARTFEKLSSHPLVGRRIQNLETSGLPGAPRHWSVLRALASAPRSQLIETQSQLSTELAIAVAPWSALVLLGGFGLFLGSLFSLGAALATSGAV